MVGLRGTRMGEGKRGWVLRCDRFRNWAGKWNRDGLSWEGRRVERGLGIGIEIAFGIGIRLK